MIRPLVAQIFMFKIVDDDGRTPDHVYAISSPMSLRLRLANNRAKATQVTEQNIKKLRRGFRIPCHPLYLQLHSSPPPADLCLSFNICNEKRDNKQCLLDTPCRVTFNYKRLISKRKSQRKNMHIYKSHMALLRITKGNYSDNILP